MNAPQDDVTADSESIFAGLRQQLDERTAERDAALAREAALAEVLGVINANPGNLMPVFDAILDKAHRICGAAVGSLVTYDGELFRVVVAHG
jgi:hypothetical protein